ncbi:hypothetical protein HYT55_02950 [Candidatus Woesearchaeota archaeon]|nr:hypothetical protein [Candidatus Woesearchaeota archaeon]
MKERIVRLRNAIRYHRDQKGDDRCWLDDRLVWEIFSGEKVNTLPSYEEGMRKCRAYFTLRSADHQDQTPEDVILDKERWDEDVMMMDGQQLEQELRRLESAIQTFYSVTDSERTIDDDRKLYGVLPEKIPADFRLPSEKDFLGLGSEKKGCPQFWRSHMHCQGKHNIHQWGPCKDGNR